MQSGRRLVLIVCAVGLAAPALPEASGTVATQARAPRASLCATDEKILFQCRSGLKLVSLCGRRTPAAGARLLYGNPGRIDYASPADAAFSWTQHGGRIEVQIRDGDREHLVYSRGPAGNASADSRAGPYSVDGLLIDRGNGMVVDHRCAGEASHHGRMQDFMPEGDARDR